MAGRSGKPSPPEHPPARVEDAEPFAFNFDDAVRPHSGQRPGKMAHGTPHYHEHRMRLRKRFDDAGAAGLQDYELLELFLFRTIPRQDTKPLAKVLLARFGSLAGVLAASQQQIEKVNGAGEAVARDLKLAQALLERAAKGEIKKRTLISSWTQLTEYCRLSMAHAPREQFRVLFLDVKNQLIADEVLNEGTIDHAPVYPREVARRALELSSAAVILVHNHPSGDPKPSQADIDITADIVAATAAIGVKVHDHLIIGRNGQVSLKSSGLL